MILAYMIARQGLSLSDALHKLRQVRPQAKPNRGFYKELLAFEAEQKQQREQ
jgi:protein-tyrosine phosphatase